jgi:choline dehydrogenase-like flavoprotein
MFQNLRDHQDGSIIETDLCIIGAGAAGITIAREFIGTSQNVLLLESGDLEPEGDTLALNEGVSVGEPHPPMETTALRFFGGTTNHWDGHCRPLDPIDFEARPWVPHSGWPITLKDLEPHYARAVPICEVGFNDFTAETWKAAFPGLIDWDTRRVVNRPWHLSPPTRFGERYREELRQADNIHVLFNANVIRIQLSENAGEVTELALKTLDGKAATVRPRQVVLACGGIENARLLLASNNVATAGVGNGNDLVGRFFMEHPHAIVAYAVPNVDITPFEPYFTGTPGTVAAGSAVIRVKPGLSEALQRTQQLPNACLDMGYGYDRSSGYLAAREIGKALSDGRMPNNFGEDILTVLGDLDGLAAGAYHYARKERMLWFGANTEQIPNPQSRVSLDNSTDALGQHRTRLNWQLTALDKEATLRTCRIVGEELARLGIARMHIDDWMLDGDTDWSGLLVRYHHMGTTRMGDNPKTSVVDRDCRIHGIANLHVAGSSVFATSGYANPTLTIVALALRLAGRLKMLKS